MLFSYIEISGELWRVAFVSEDGTEVALHSKSIVRKGALTSGWVLFNFPSPRQTADGMIRSQAEKWVVNCELARFSKSDTVSYAGPFATGSVVQSWSGETREQGAVPGSIGDELSEAMCQQTAGSPQSPG